MMTIMICAPYGVTLLFHWPVTWCGMIGWGKRRNHNYTCTNWHFDLPPLLLQEKRQWKCCFRQWNTVVLMLVWRDIKPWEWFRGLQIGLWVMWLQFGWDLMSDGWAAGCVSGAKDTYTLNSSATQSWQKSIQIWFSCKQSHRFPPLVARQTFLDKQLLRKVVDHAPLQSASLFILFWLSSRMWRFEEYFCIPKKGSAASDVLCIDVGLAGQARWSEREKRE